MRRRVCRMLGVVLRKDVADTLFVLTTPLPPLSAHSNSSNYYETQRSSSVEESCPIISMHPTAKTMQLKPIMDTVLESGGTHAGEGKKRMEFEQTFYENEV